MIWCIWVSVELGVVMVCSIYFIGFCSIWYRILCLKVGVRVGMFVGCFISWSMCS